MYKVPYTKAIYLVKMYSIIFEDKSIQHCDSTSKRNDHFNFPSNSHPAPTPNKWFSASSMVRGINVRDEKLRDFTISGSSGFHSAMVF